MNSTVFGGRAPRPTHVTNFEVPFVVDAAQDLPRGAPPQMLQKGDKRGEPKLYPAPAILGPPRIFRIRAEGFRSGVRTIFRSAATAVNPHSVRTKKPIRGPFGKSFSFAL